MFEHDQSLVNQLVNENQVFRKLYKTHHELKERIQAAEVGVNPIEDLALNALKKKKLQMKDQMAAMLDDYRRGHAAA